MNIETPEQYTQLKNGDISGHLQYYIKCSVQQHPFADVKEIARFGIYTNGETIVFEGKADNHIKLNPKQKSVEARMYHREIGLNRFEYLPTDYESYNVVIGAINETDLHVIAKLPRSAKIAVETTDAIDAELLDRISEMAKSFTGEFTVKNTVSTV